MTRSTADLPESGGGGGLAPRQGFRGGRRAQARGVRAHQSGAATGGWNHGDRNCRGGGSRGRGGDAHGAGHREGRAGPAWASGGSTTGERVQGGKTGQTERAASSCEAGPRRGGPAGARACAGRVCAAAGTSGKSRGTSLVPVSRRRRPTRPPASPRGLLGGGTRASGPRNERPAQAPGAAWELSFGDAGQSPLPLRQVSKRVADAGVSRAFGKQHGGPGVDSLEAEAAPVPGGLARPSPALSRPERPQCPLTRAPAWQPGACWGGGGGWPPLGSLPCAAGGLAGGGETPGRRPCAHLLGPRWPRAQTQQGQGRGREAGGPCWLSPVRQGLQVPGWVPGVGDRLRDAPTRVQTLAGAHGTAR